MKRTLKGFTLIELMVTLVIVAILAAVAVPNYQKYVMKTRRIEVIKAIEDLVTAREKYFLDKNQYPTTLSQLAPYGVTQITESGNYYLNMTATMVHAQTYPGRAQAGDRECIAFRYTFATGSRRSSGEQADGTVALHPADADPCWPK